MPAPEQKDIHENRTKVASTTFYYLSSLNERLWLADG